MVLTADLGHDHGPGRDDDGALEGGEIDLLLGSKPRVNLHSLSLGVVARHMLDLPQLDTRTEFAVDAGKEIPCERFRNARCVVVRRVERRLVLDEIDSQQQVVTGRQRIRQTLPKSV